MLATISNLIRLRLVHLALVFSLALTVASCANKDTAPLIADPNAARDTALPWNEQQKWEREGEASAFNQQRR
jgi:hypothetical protein